MRIELTPEREKIIEGILQSGRFRTVEEVIAAAVEVLGEKEHFSTATKRKVSRRAAVREILDFVGENRVRLKGVTVKDLIREGRRR
jgi:Arc/MetJ-type ribon-helix-helix transcriptional regulator